MPESKKKIFNDPIYGLITFRHEIIYDVINHPIFQRLRRIAQMGLASYVYPGANHTRFHHALGALHLMTRALNVLRNKGIDITDDEHEAASLAILLHDIGHGPFSHTLEGKIISVHHEQLSLEIMYMLNKEFDGRLDLAIQIFKGEHPKLFLHELVSSQLDMDRLDYLTRDSFYTGVAEGVVGYDRIIQMLNVANGHLVVEEKGFYSIEKFLTSRRIMYWQVYLHKTALCAEKMLAAYVERLTKLVRQGDYDQRDALTDLLSTKKNYDSKIDQSILGQYIQIDDFDIYTHLKYSLNHNDFLLKYWSRALLDRRLHKIELADKAFGSDYLEKTRLNICNKMITSVETANELVLAGKETNLGYKINSDEIKVLYKDGSTAPYSKISNNAQLTSVITKYYLCIPRIKD